MAVLSGRGHGVAEKLCDRGSSFCQPSRYLYTELLPTGGRLDPGESLPNGGLSSAGRFHWPPDFDAKTRKPTRQPQGARLLILNNDGVQSFVSRFVARTSAIIADCSIKTYSNSLEYTTRILILSGFFPSSQRGLKTIFAVQPTAAPS